MTVRWGEKRYYSLDYYLKTTYGEKLYKISLDGGMTCPNRDGTLGTRGCIFPTVTGLLTQGDVFFAVPEVPVILPKAIPCLSQSRLNPVKNNLRKNIPDHPTSLISRHTPILMLLLHIWKSYIWKPSCIPISGFCPSQPDRIA